MNTAHAVSYFLYGMGAVALFCFLLQTVWYCRKERREKKRLAAFYRDFEMVQRMFDALHVLDKKWDGRTETIRQLLEQSVERNEALYERQRQLAEQLEILEKSLSAMQYRPGIEPATEGSADSPRSQTAFPFVRSAPRMPTAMPATPVDPEGARAAFRSLLKHAHDEGSANGENEGASDASDWFGPDAEPPSRET